MPGNKINLLNRIRGSSTVYHFPTRASEWVAAVILFNWGISISLTDGLIMQPLGPLLGIMRVELWMFIFIFLGLGRIILLIVNGALKKTSHIRSLMAFLSCFVWFQIVFVYAYADTVTTAINVYPVLLALDFYNAYRTAVQARVTDEGYKENARSD